MALLVNAQRLSKSFGADPLFEEITLQISEGDRIGVIGPNGSGKSTLLQILAGRIAPDSGEVALRRNTRLSYVAQDSKFPPGLTIRQVMERAAERAAIGPEERTRRISETLGRAGFDDFAAEAAALSGGWRKRLAIAEAVVEDPEILLLDEPTNHLDLAAIEWLENLLAQSPFACAVISHDRYFLENVATRMIELNRAYPAGLLAAEGNYGAFLEKKAEFLHAQAKRQESLENRVRREVEWLRRGAKARTTKSKARIAKAQEMIGELATLESRAPKAKAGIDFDATGRRTKRLVELEGVSFAFENRPIVRNLDFVITAGTRIGLTGPNGSGKTTLLRLLRGGLEPQAGTIKRAEALRIVHFDQNRVLDESLTLKRALAPEGDSVVYRDRVIHVAGWAARFLFASEQLGQPVSKLSGGERARVLIAQLMLQPADLLLLDEPTNDLDIPTLEVLEESLIEFPGALVLVTHDRFLLDRVSTTVLGLDGSGAAGTFADYAQWDAWRQSRNQPEERKPAPKPEAAPPPSGKKKLSYLEGREFETIEQRIAEAESLLAARQAALEDPEVYTDGRRAAQAQAEMEEAQRAVDALYARWAELEAKLS